MSELIQEIVKRVDKVMEGNARPIPLHLPSFIGNEWKYVKECIDTGWVSSVGAYVDKFEKVTAEYTGAKYAVATVNGTAALHIALLMAGVKSGDEVLSPALTFIATTNAISYCNAVPHFIDVEEATMGIDAAKLREYLSKNFVKQGGSLVNKATGRRVGAVVGMHTFGFPFDLDGVLDVCKSFGVPLVEDAAESLGSYYKGKHTGTFGLVGTLSYNGNKTITTGGGGMILTNDEKIAKHAKHITTTAKVPHKWEYVHDEVGYNYRLPNLNAALGVAQMESLPGLIEKKRAIADRYIKAFAGLEGAKIFSEASDTKVNYWLNTLVLAKGKESLRDGLLTALIDAQIFSRPIWRPMHELQMFSQCPKADLSATESLCARVVNVPSSSHL